MQKYEGGKYCTLPHVIELMQTDYEPSEENTIIGWRGASRYYAEAYKGAFGMECKVMKKVREVMDLDNVVLMVLFCRTVGELDKVYETMAAYGLKMGENGLEVYLMADIPSNVILAEQFGKHMDGFSVGSNGLTQLVLRLDRDPSLISGLHDERNDAVKFMVSSLIRTAKKMKVKWEYAARVHQTFSISRSFW